MKSKLFNLLIMGAAALFLFLGVMPRTSSANPIWIPNPNDFTGESDNLQNLVTPTPVEDPQEALALYAEGLILFEEEMYYSAWEAFTSSGYGDWEERAEACAQPQPETGELFHAESELPEDMMIKFIARQKDTSNMFIRVYREEELVSSVFISGPGKVSIKLPGDTEYSIKEGDGEIWYGEKEAFGRNGYYETVYLNHEGLEKYLFKSNYSYEITISKEPVDYEDPHDFDRIGWDSF